MAAPTIPPVPVGSSVSIVLAALAFVGDMLDANEDVSQEDALAAAFCEVEDRFVFQPVRSTSDAITKLEYVVARDDLDPIDEDLIRSVIAYLRSQVAT
jgi:hypothetical protein